LTIPRKSVPYKRKVT
jgi:hypothetical protein